MVRSFYDQTAPEVYVFDAAVQFPPHFPTAPIISLIAGKDAKFKGTIYDYTELRKAALEQLITRFKHRQNICRGNALLDTRAAWSHAVIWQILYRSPTMEWLSATVEQVQKKKTSGRAIDFINAWNGRAEGCHLEPDEKYGHAWLNGRRWPATAGPPNAAHILAEPIPEPAKNETIKVPALRDRLRL